MKKLYVLIALPVSVLIYSCGSDTETTTTVSTNETSNTTINGDTAKPQAPQSVEEKLINLASATAKDLYEEWEKGDSIRDASEPQKWVYVIGDSYEDEDLAAEAYDKYKDTESDVFVFRKKRKRFYLIKGIGLSSRKSLDDSLDIVQKRLNASIDIIDLSKACRKRPTNTDNIKYKIDGEKKYAPCKKCE